MEKFAATAAAATGRYSWQNVGKKAASKKLLAKYTGKYGWQKNPLAIIYWQKSTLANTYWQIYTSIFLAGILVLAKKSTSKKLLAKAASKYRHWRKCPETILGNK